MSVLYKSCIVRRLWAVFLGLPLLCACSLVTATDDDPTEPQPSPSTETAHYINLNIVVSSGNENAGMRAPLGGEDGDGRETGLKRENEVVGITLMLYRDDDGINTTSEETKFDFVKYYPVKVLEHVKPGITPSNPGNDEVVFTTGDQPLQGTGLDLSQPYHAIVVANRNLEDQAEKTVKAVRDLTESKIFNIGGGIGIDAEGFVMASENDAVIDFSKRENRREEGNNVYFTFDGICIERLAARIDFWTKGAEYDEIKKGYKYEVKTASGSASNDYFVLTSVTPFNFYNAEEYYIKRVNPSDGTFKYLEKETKVSYVIDPKTNDKGKVGSSAPTYYDNPLSNLIENGLSDVEGYYQMMETLHNSSQKAAFTDDEGKDNFILGYPKENALMLASPLYYYATGVAIEGYYYKGGTGEGEHRIYYGFLRHQGEGSATTYDINTAKDFEEDKNKPVSDQGTPMNFSIVRNNIYRISIDRITEKGITWQIQVKKWDTFTHETIYM